MVSAVKKESWGDAEHRWRGDRLWTLGVQGRPLRGGDISAGTSVILMTASFNFRTVVAVCSDFGL